MDENDAKCAKLAPIFCNMRSKTLPNIETVRNKKPKKNKVKENGLSSKRTKKSPKLKIKKRPKIIENETKMSETMNDCRRSTRLKNKVVNCEQIVVVEVNDDAVNDIETDSDDTIIDDNEWKHLDETNASDDECVVNLNNTVLIDSSGSEQSVIHDENSDTLQYWTEVNAITNGLLDDIEIIYSRTAKSVSQDESTATITVTNECQRECLLWTEKYKPRNCSQVIGNKKAVNKLKLWLEDWRKTIDYKSDYVELNDDCDQYLDDSKTCVLITGPTGCGKTSMVYAIAEECKFHVLEINGSMKRNGRIVSKIVLEATQSHHMKRCSNPLFPVINRSQSNDDSDCVRIEAVIDHKKANTKKKSKKDNGLLKYFSVKQSDKTDNNKSKDKCVENKVQKEVINVSENVSQTNGKFSDCSQSSVSQNTQQSATQKSLTITSNSLILFDDVDIMLDENINGFWAAINKINEITKIPVILTATQHIPYIKSCVNRLQVLSLDVPDLNETSHALSNIYDKELNDNLDIVNAKVYERIANTYSNDIRRCINEMQFDSLKWINTQNHTSNCDDNNKKKLFSYYDTIIFSDIIENEFNLLNSKENRDFWMKCVPTVMDDETHDISLAKDIVLSINNLNVRKDRYMNLSDTLPPIKESSYLEALSPFLNKTTDKKSLHLDYCPYLSYICEYEDIRRSRAANHSRRSRRFMHHLDSIGIYISDTIKTKLISCFVSHFDSNLKTDSEDSSTDIENNSNSDFD